jgi:hypothetical protein
LSDLIVCFDFIQEGEFACFDTNAFRVPLLPYVFLLPYNWFGLDLVGGVVQKYEYIPPEELESYINDEESKPALLKQPKHRTPEDFSKVCALTLAST